jgi:hypothetical protein
MEEGIHTSYILNLIPSDRAVSEIDLINDTIDLLAISCIK